jgi:hypothetical protein
MDWLENVENIEDEDEPLLRDFEEDGELAERVEKFVDRNTPTKDAVHKILEIIINCMKTTTESIEDTWSNATGVTPEAQKESREYARLMQDKVRFFMSIYTKMLDHHRWKRFQTEIYTNVNIALLAILPLLEAYPHKPKNVRPTLLHFCIKTHLSECACTIWNSLVPEDTISSTTVIPLDLLIPTMRRLGMMDVLDKDWNMCGDWNEILEVFQRQAPLQKTSADKILQELSLVWKLARNSMQCRTHHNFPGMPAALSHAPQCFHHFSKCTARACANVETPQKPHKIRCKKCWYFHCCSLACESYAEMFDQHQCSFTPPDKVALIKAETELFLKPKSLAEEVYEGKRCNFCLTKQENHSGKMMRCGACQSVWYCSRECQQWDWSLGSHKAQCTK